ncbi:MAG: TrkA family potassium uptake protein [Chloroflexi bacterium]|nr:TrkA family potassium uptake protein [Chloroflexota bacterium]
MYIIVAGGGKVGYFLSKSLVAEGHEVLIIEKNAKKCLAIADDLGSIVMRGDACEAATLEETGAARADVIVAVTGDDEDNLVICQMAKVKYHVPRTIARINNPRNEKIFKLLGIDVTVSTTELILAHIQQEISAPDLIHLLRLRHADLEIVEARITPDARAAHRPLRDLGIPSTCAISAIIRNGKVVIPSGETCLEPEDEVIAACAPASEDALREALGTRDVPR